MKLLLSSDPRLLCAVRGAVERFAESFGFSEEDARAVTRAVDEAVTNIIRHAYNGQAGRPIELSLDPLARRGASGEMNALEIILSDRGPAIKKQQLCARALDELRPGGLGLHFIQESMDVVQYSRVKGTNRLRLVKYNRASKPA
ncbi:MAG TPA: ATP-binding protein [Candidatus Acidoferrum sp.]|nr:ATP-binding protein [Candidatus Acidoferrum sp.]